MLKRRTLLVVIVLAAAAGGWYWWSRRDAGAQQGPRFETASAERGRLVAKVTATGTLSALVTVQVGSQVSGRIQEILVDFNSPVKKGQLIARIDPQIFQATVAQARANFVAAQGNLSKAKVQAADAERVCQRTKSLFEKKLVAQADLETAQAAADAARAQVEATAGTVEQSRASLQQAEVNLAYTSILSPINGVVISRNVDVGQTVAASLQAPTLFVIAEDLRKMQVDTSVAEADVGKLQAGMASTFTVDAFPTERFAGTIRQVRNAPQTVQNVVTYDAVIDVDNLELKLKPGMTANVLFVYAQKDDVTRIPNAALRFRPTPDVLAAMRAANGAANVGAGARGDGGFRPKSEGRDDDSADRRTVWVLKPDRPMPVPVKVRVGITDGTVSELVEGDLRPGDALVTDATGGEKPKFPGGGGPGGMRRVF